MDELTAQLNAVSLTNGVPNDRCTNEKIPSGSYMSVCGGETDRELAFRTTGCVVFTIPYRRRWLNNTSGALCRLGNYPIVVTTTGYKNVEYRPLYQLDNADWTRKTWYVCDAMDYFLVPTKQDDAFDGQYFAHHVEKQLLAYVYFHHTRHPAIPRARYFVASTEIEELGHVKLYVDKPVCFDCMVFIVQFERYTGIRVLAFSNGEEQVDRHREPINAALDHLADLKQWSDTLSDCFSQVKSAVQNGCNILTSRGGMPPSARPDKTLEDWLQGLLKVKLQRAEGNIHLRQKEPSRYLGFVDDD